MKNAGFFIIFCLISILGCGPIPEEDAVFGKNPEAENINTPQGSEYIPTPRPPLMFPEIANPMLDCTQINGEETYCFSREEGGSFGGCEITYYIYCVTNGLSYFCVEGCLYPYDQIAPPMIHPANPHGQS